MQAHHAAQDPSSNNGAPEKRQPYVPPVIPMGLAHVVQFVTGSLLDQSAKCQLVGDRMSRYAQADGTVSMAQTFICEISGLGSKNTAIKYLETMRARGILEIEDEQGGNTRKSKRYRFLGEQFGWKPVAVERPGTDFRAALYEARQEIRDLREENDNLRANNELLQAQLDLLTNETATGHPEAISHSEVTNGEGVGTPETPSHSYEKASPESPHEPSAPIRHFEVTNGEGSRTPETASGSYETASPEPVEEPSDSIRPFEVTNGLTEGQEYLARRARVQPLVMEFRAYYDTSYRGGTNSAVHYFSRSADTERELLMQVETLRADREAAAEATGPPGAAEQPESSGRSEVEYCPDCGTPSPPSEALITAQTAPPAGVGKGRLDDRQEGRYGADPQVHPRERGVFRPGRPGLAPAGRVAQVLLGTPGRMVPGLGQGRAAEAGEAG